MNFLFLLIFLSNFYQITAQLGSLYSFLDDDSLFSNEQPIRPKTVTRVVSSSRDSIENQRETLDEDEKIVNDFGNIVSQTNDLFSKLFGMIGGETTMEIHRPKQQKDSTEIRSTKKNENDQKSDSTMQKVFHLFDSISSIPFNSRRVQGQHICVREITKEFKARDGVTSAQHRCQRFRKAQKCIERRENENEKGKETARIEECCEGWETDDIMIDGCKRASEIASVEDRLYQLNYTNSNEISVLGLEKFLHSKETFTFLMPRKTKSANGTAMILPNIQRDYDWFDGDLVKSVDGGKFYISQYSDYSQVRTEINCVAVIRANLPVSNGVVHVTDGMLHPSASSLLSALQADHRFSTFLSLMSNETKSLLSSFNQYTIFAITNEDFEKLEEKTREKIRRNDGCVKDIALSQIFQSSICFNALAGKTLISLNGNVERVQEMVSKDGDSYVRLGDARIKEGNLVADNGVIHLIDHFIRPQQLLTWRDHLSIHSPSLLPSLRDLSTREPVTIFIPLNATMNGSTFDVKDQVVLGEVLDLDKGGQTEFWSGKKIFYGHPKHKASPISMRISFGHSFPIVTRIGCSDVIDTPIHSCNSIIYFIDKPIKSSRMNIVEYIQSRDDLSNFSNLLTKSGVESLFKYHKSPMTVFVPTNDAFSRNLLKKLTLNSTLAAHFVRKYIVDEPLCRSDLAHSRSEIKIETYANLEGENLLAEGSIHDLYIDGAQIIGSEMLLSDGIVYVLESTIDEREENRQRRRMIGERIEGIEGLTGRGPLANHRSFPLSLLNIFGN